MAWYGISLISKLQYNDSPTIERCEETITLISSLTKEEAIEKALLIGKQEESSYKNNQGEICNWIFIGIGGAYEIIDEKIEDKTEIFSRFLKYEEALSLLRS